MGSLIINPRKWRYTYSAESHIPLLKLYLFTPHPSLNPLTTHCSNNLTVSLLFEKSLILISSWSHPRNDHSAPPSSNLITTLAVPLPRLLLDLDSPLSFRPLYDHIEVKIPLLLPVDHPIVSSFVSELSSGDDDVGGLSDEFIEPLSMESDFKELSAKGEVEVYCRNCAFKLTKRSVRCLVDLPSVNWTDVADNWFGTCCCSFGGISEKLVGQYVKSYRCEEGTCLLTSASIILFKDDVAGFASLPVDQSEKCDEKDFNEISTNTNNDVRASGCCSTGDTRVPDSSTKQGDSFVKEECTEHDEQVMEKSSSPSHVTSFLKDDESEHKCCTHVGAESIHDQELNGPAGLEAEQKSFLNCYLGNAFLFRSSGLSKDIEWIDFACPQCSTTLGAYPCSNGSEPLDSGIRLLKCYISISSPSSLSNDLFRKYTLERMFTCQLLESAKDELSFRTVVKDVKTKSSVLHVVLVNPNSWCCSGWCSENTAEHFIKINLQPVVKVLFSRCHDNVESEVRTNQEWETKNQVDEVYLSKHLISELMKSMERAKDTFPLSFSSTNEFLLSYILR